MSAKVSVKMNRAALKALSDAQIKATTMAAEQMLDEAKMEGLIPVKTGNLLAKTHVDATKAKKGIVQIVSDTEYAARVYAHPESEKGGWWDGWLHGSKKPIEVFKKLYRKAIRGYVK